MFAVKPRIEIVFRVVMAAAILLTTPLNVISARADDVTVTPTQTLSETPTAEPTSTSTETVVPATETMVTHDRNTHFGDRNPGAPGNRSHYSDRDGNTNGD